jgi:hypothetical protein
VEKYNSKDLSKKQHEIYLKKINNYNINHTEKILNYHFNTSKIDDKSFFFVEGEKPMAFVPLGITNKNNFTTLSFSKTACHVPLLSEDMNSQTRKRVFREIYKKIYEIGTEYKCESLEFFFHPIKFSNNECLLDYKESMKILSYFNVSYVAINTNIIDLNLSIDNIFMNLRKAMRKEFRSKIYKELEFFKINMENKNKDQIKKNFDIYKKYHFISANKQTRPDSSWDYMLNLLYDDKADLFAIRRLEDKKFLSFLYCFKEQNFASGASQVNILDPIILHKYSLRAFLEYKTIKHYKDNNFRYYEIGQTYYFDKDFKSFTEKHKRIGLTKLQFGGGLYPIFYFKFDFTKGSIFDNNHNYIVENEF